MPQNNPHILTETERTVCVPSVPAMTPFSLLIAIYTRCPLSRHFFAYLVLKEKSRKPSQNN